MPSGAPHTCGVVVIDADRRVVSKHGQALLPPTGTAVWPSGPSGALHAGGQVVDVWFGASFPMSGQAPSPTDTVAIPVGLAAVSTLAVLGMDAPKVQTTSVKLSEFGVFWVRWSAL